MITAVCGACELGIRTLGDAREEAAFYADAEAGDLKCPKCRAVVQIFESISGTASGILDIRDLSVQEAYAAFNGLGLPEERECSPTAVRMALRSPVKAVNVKLLRGSNRSLIESLELESGDVLHFGSSPFGAVVYRISNG